MIGTGEEQVGFPYSKWLEHTTLLSETINPFNPLSTCSLHNRLFDSSFGKW